MFHVAVLDGDTLIEGRFKIEGSKEPKWIDWIDSIGEDAGKVIPAIYTLSQDIFESAAADPDMKRQVDFCGGKGITIRGMSESADSEPASWALFRS